MYGYLSPHVYGYLSPIVTLHYVGKGRSFSKWCRVSSTSIFFKTVISTRYQTAHSKINFKLIEGLNIQIIRLLEDHIGKYLLTFEWR